MRLPGPARLDPSCSPHAFNLLSSHRTQTGSSDSPRRKYLPSSNGPEHSCSRQFPSVFRFKGLKTHHANEAINMPLCPQRLDHRIRNRLPALPTLCTEPIRMAPHAPGVPLLLDKRRLAIERVAALGAEKVSDVPLGAARDHDLALDGRLARLAPRREHLVEVEVAVEPEALVEPVLVLEPLHVFVRGVRVQHGEVLAALAGLDPADALRVFVGGLRVEGYALEVLAAVVALEAFGVEADAGSGDDAPGDGEGTLLAEGTCADRGGRPVGAGGSRGVGSVERRPVLVGYR